MGEAVTKSFREPDGSTVLNPIVAGETFGHGAV